jgi:V-type H+-transporting ATPase subunit C
MSSFWFLSAPADPTRQEALNKLKDKIQTRLPDLAELFAIPLPDLKIGTLDAVYVLSDELAKMDPAIESISVKIADNMRNLLSNDQEQLRSNLVVNDRKFHIQMIQK